MGEEVGDGEGGGGGRGENNTISFTLLYKIPHVFPGVPIHTESALAHLLCTLLVIMCGDTKNESNLTLHNICCRIMMHVCIYMPLAGSWEKHEAKQGNRGCLFQGCSTVSSIGRQMCNSSICRQTCNSSICRQM